MNINHTTPITVALVQITAQIILFFDKAMSGNAHDLEEPLDLASALDIVENCRAFVADEVAYQEYVAAFIRKCIESDLSQLKSMSKLLDTTVTALLDEPILAERSSRDSFSGWLARSLEACDADSKFNTDLTLTLKIVKKWQSETETLEIQKMFTNVASSVKSAFGLRAIAEQSREVWQSTWNDLIKDIDQCLEMEYYHSPGEEYFDRDGIQRQKVIETRKAYNVALDVCQKEIGKLKEQVDIILKVIYAITGNWAKLNDLLTDVLSINTSPWTIDLEKARESFEKCEIDMKRLLDMKLPSEEDEREVVPEKVKLSLKSQNIPFHALQKPDIKIPIPRQHQQTPQRKSSSLNTSKVANKVRKNVRLAKLRALFDCVADAETELSFVEDEILYVLYWTNDDWWWCVNEKGEKGHVPGNYVEVLDIMANIEGFQPDLENLQYPLEENEVKSPITKQVHGDKKTEESIDDKAVPLNVPVPEISINEASDKPNRISRSASVSHVDAALSIPPARLRKNSEVGVPQRRQRRYSTKDVPLIVTDCIKYLEKKGLKEEGIFRIPGNHYRIKKLATEYENGFRPSLEDELDPLTIAGLLKYYLMVTRDPPISRQLAEKIRHAMNVRSEQTQIKVMKRILDDRRVLPLHHWRTLFVILNLFVRITSHEASTKMNAKNLSKVFGLTLFQDLLGVTQANFITELWIKHFEKLFDEEIR